MKIPMICVHTTYFIFWIYVLYFDHMGTGYFSIIFIGPCGFETLNAFKVYIQVYCFTIYISRASVYVENLGIYFIVEGNKYSTCQYIIQN